MRKPWYGRAAVRQRTAPAVLFAVKKPYVLNAGGMPESDIAPTDPGLIILPPIYDAAFLIPLS